MLVQILLHRAFSDHCTSLSHGNRQLHPGDVIPPAMRATNGMIRRTTPFSELISAIPLLESVVNWGYAVIRRLQ
jgi:hypothetical protein